MRPIKHIHGDKAPQWVGDGFYVKTLINHLEDHPDFNYSHTDPFLLLDYGQPTTFTPNPNYENQPHGIGRHPHKGFETVTIAYSGEISHADSAGGSGVITEGDAQWMTAGRGITHEEFHSPSFGKNGGVFSMVQMWINLPSAHKLTEPKYQTLSRQDLPTIELICENNSTEGEHIPIGRASIIAGNWYGVTGVASTFSPINLWDVEIHTSGTIILEVPNSHNAMLLVQQGEVIINDTSVQAGQLVQFAAPTQDKNTAEIEQTMGSIKVTYISSSDTQPVNENNESPAKLLLLSGEPIGEPVAAYGPFVMNTPEELKQTIRDYQRGNFG